MSIYLAVWAPFTVKGCHRAPRSPRCQASWSRIIAANAPVFLLLWMCAGKVWHLKGLTLHRSHDQSLAVKNSHLLLVIFFLCLAPKKTSEKQRIRFYPSNQLGKGKLENGSPWDRTSADRKPKPKVSNRILQMIATMWGLRSIAKLVYNSNNYDLWYL